MTLEAGRRDRADAHGDARASSLEKIAEAIERELAVLREARPHLESRIDRAAGLLVMQLASGPRTRPMRVRVGAAGKRARFLVGSLTEAGAVYVVDPKGWNCSCPDHPHEYTLKREQDPGRFDAAARTIWECGYDRHYLRRAWRTPIVGDYICWVWTRPEGSRHPYPTDTILVNRAERHRGRVA